MARLPVLPVKRLELLAQDSAKLLVKATKPECLARLRVFLA